MARQSIYKRARHTVDKQKKKVILQYMRENPDLVINSSVTVIKGLRFWMRLKFALDILRGNGRKRRMEAYMYKEDVTEKGDRYVPPGHKDTKDIPPRPDVTPPAQKPKKDSIYPDSIKEDYNRRDEERLRNL